MSFDKAKARAAFASSREDLKVIKVEPFGEVYWRPATMREVMRIMPKGQESEYAFALENVLVRSLKSDGTRLFSDAERMELEKEYPPELIGVLSGQMPLVTPAGDVEKHP